MSHHVTPVKGNGSKLDGCRFVPYDEDMAGYATPEDIMREIGGRLRRLRAALQLRQEDMAELMGVSRNALANYERGHRAADMMALARLSLRTGVSLDWLVLGNPARLPSDIAPHLLSDNPVAIALPRDN
jgi:DNA-binding XRE family transcriptional regulator